MTSATFMRRCCNHCGAVCEHERNGKLWSCSVCSQLNPDSADLVPGKPVPTVAATLASVNARAPFTDPTLNEPPSGWNSMKSEDVDNPRTAERLAEVAASENAKLVYTCRTCLDTHQMELDERVVPCTHCPLPCTLCRGGLSAYCKSTPCSCSCHFKRATPPGVAQPVIAALTERERAELEQLRMAVASAKAGEELLQATCEKLTAERDAARSAGDRYIKMTDAQIESLCMKLEALEKERDDLLSRLANEKPVSALSHLLAQAGVNHKARAEGAERRLAELTARALEVRGARAVDVFSAGSMFAAAMERMGRVLDRQARETSAAPCGRDIDCDLPDEHAGPHHGSDERAVEASAESARETLGGERGSVAQTSPVDGIAHQGQESPEPAEEQGRSTADEAQGEALTAEWEAERIEHAKGGRLTAGVVVLSLRDFTYPLGDEDDAPAGQLPNEDAAEIVTAYVQQEVDAALERELRDSTLAEAGRDLTVARQQLAAARAECERLRQGPDARLREAAERMAVAWDAFDEWQTRHELLSEMDEDEIALYDLVQAGRRALRSALAADPAPQVEREALPTLAELRGRAVVYASATKGSRDLRITAIERWIEARDASRESGALGKAGGGDGK